MAERAAPLRRRGGEGIVIGVLPEETPSVAPGVVEITGKGCALRLGADGTVAVSGSRISVTGPLYINGEAYEKCRCAEV